jgi:cytochrome c
MVTRSGEGSWFAWGVDFNFGHPQLVTRNRHPYSSLFVLLTISALTLAAVPAMAQDAKRGQKIFENCAACHAADGKGNEVGPGLGGIFGRKAGERDDFRYSPALKRSGITWTPQTMDTFLADPQKAVPANRMPFAGISDARERADLIAYMQQAFK